MTGSEYFWRYNLIWLKLNHWVATKVWTEFLIYSVRILHKKINAVGYINLGKPFG